MKHERAGWIKPLARFMLYLFLLPVCAAAEGFSAEQDSLRLRLRAEAGEVRLWQDSYWLRLLDYGKNVFGDYRSPSVDPACLLSPQGRTSPEAELAAAIDGLFAPGPDDDSPECRFPGATAGSGKAQAVRENGSPQAMPGFRRVVGRHRSGICQPAFRRGLP